MECMHNMTGPNWDDLTGYDQSKRSRTVKSVLSKGGTTSSHEERPNKEGFAGEVTIGSLKFVLYFCISNSNKYRYLL